MSYFRQRFIEELSLHGYSKNTIDVYVRSVRQLCDYYKSKPAVLTDEQIRRYLLSLREGEKPPSDKTYNVVVSAINRFFEYCLPKQKRPILSLVTPAVILPEVFSADEVRRLFDAVTNLKYKTILALMYSAGLRIGECVKLKATDIDSGRMLVRISQAKGKKDRYAPLGFTALDMLRQYFRCYKPATYLFENGQTKHPLHVRSIQKVFKQAIRDAGITKTVRPHTLRHSFATTLLEQKCPIVAIQNFLGHARIQSTLIYTHVTPTTLADIVNPLDALRATSTTETSHG